MFDSTSRTPEGEALRPWHLRGEALQVAHVNNLFTRLLEGLGTLRQGHTCDRKACALCRLLALRLPSAEHFETALKQANATWPDRGVRLDAFERLSCLWDALTQGRKAIEHLETLDVGGPLDPDGTAYTWDSLIANELRVCWYQCQHFANLITSDSTVLTEWQSYRKDHGPRSDDDEDDDTDDDGDPDDGDGGPTDGADVPVTVLRGV